MAELIALGSVVASAAAIAKYVTACGKSTEKTPVYTLTPPAFDRVRDDAQLTQTPLETFVASRQRLFADHYTGDEGERLLDVRLHMAPPPVGGPLASRPSHDFMAHIYLPRLQPGQVIRPLAEARFHLQHAADPCSYTNFTLRTEGGGAADVSGALNLTGAVRRMQAAARATADQVKPTTPGQSKAAVPIPVSTPATRAAAASQSTTAPTPQTSSGPRGVSVFFNLPLFRATPEDAPANRGGAGAAVNVFTPKRTLRDGSAVGFRLDERTEDGRSSYSLGVHCDPQTTLAAVQSNQLEALQVGGWISQETDMFRMCAEATVQPMRSALPSAASSDLSRSFVNVGAEGAASAGVVRRPASGAASVLPPRLAASLPAVVSSRFGLFYTPARITHTQPGYEVGATLTNDSTGAQQFCASYFHHLVVRRNIKNPFEKKENRAINNTIDLGFEVLYASQYGVAPEQAVRTPPSLRFGASWQVNKNSLIKFRVQDATVSCVYALKSWWQPSASGALSVNHGLQTRATTFGLSVNVENIGEVLFAKPDPAYRRMIASQRENVANQVDQDEDY